MSIDTIPDTVLRRQLINRHEKLIQETKTDLMAVYIAAMEAKRYQDQTLFKEETDHMWQNHDNHVENNEMTEVLLRLISKRSWNMNEKCKVMFNFAINYCIPSSHDLLTHIEKDKKEENVKRTSFLASLIIDPTIRAVHYLTDQQLQLLNRGPTYVTPCQMHVSSSFETIDDIVNKQYAPLKHQLAVLFDKYRADISRQLHFNKYAYIEFKKLYSTPIPTDIYERAIYEKKLIQSIQYFLMKNNLILRRTADQNNVFYLGNRKEFIEASNQYMEKNADRYTVLMNTNEMNEQQVQQLLNKKFELLNQELDDLHKKKRITITVLETLQVKIDQVKLPYLYFLPNVAMVSKTKSYFILRF